MQLHAAHGRKWLRIAAAMPGRSSASIRNRFMRLVKGREARANGLSKNRCAACGQHKLGHICTAKLKMPPAPEMAHRHYAPLILVHAHQAVAHSMGLTAANGVSLLALSAMNLTTPTIVHLPASTVADAHQASRFPDSGRDQGQAAQLLRQNSRQILESLTNFSPCMKNIGTMKGACSSFQGFQDASQLNKSDEVAVADSITTNGIPQSNETQTSVETQTDFYSA